MNPQEVADAFRKVLDDAGAIVVDLNKDLPKQLRPEESESARMRKIIEVNPEAGSRAALEEQYGQVWTMDEVTAQFEITSFLAPYVYAVERKTGRKVRLAFQHHPRFYFSLTDR